MPRIAPVKAARRTASASVLAWAKGVTLAYLGNLLYRLESVENYRFTAPAEDIAASPTILPVLGGVAITELEG